MHRFAAWRLVQTQLPAACPGFQSPAVPAVPAVAVVALADFQEPSLAVLLRLSVLRHLAVQITAHRWPAVPRRPVPTDLLVAVLRRHCHSRRQQLLHLGLRCSDTQPVERRRIEKLRCCYRLAVFLKSELGHCSPRVSRLPEKLHQSVAVDTLTAAVTEKLPGRTPV